MENHYAKKYRRIFWQQVKDTWEKRGCYVPVGGWRKLGKARFVAVNQQNLDGEIFDSVANFSCAEIGEIASRVGDKNLPKNCVYALYGFRSVIFANRPCFYCREARTTPCDCDIAIQALRKEFEDIKSQLPSLTEPFDIVILPRTFDLKVAN